MNGNQWNQWYSIFKIKLGYTAYEIMTYFKGQILYVTFRTGVPKLSY